MVDSRATTTITAISTNVLTKVTQILWLTPMPGLKSLREMATFNIAMETTTTTTLEAHLAWVKPSRCHALITAGRADPLSIHWSSARICKSGEMKRFRKPCMVVIGVEDLG